MSDVNFEKVRDTAIAMITSALHASSIEDENERIEALADGMRFAADVELTAGEFSSIPSVLVQIAESFVRLCAEAIEADVMELWAHAVEQIRTVPLVGERDQDD